jgi:hypothetical protein
MLTPLTIHHDAIALLVVPRPRLLIDFYEKLATDAQFVYAGHAAVRSDDDLWQHITSRCLRLFPSDTVTAKLHGSREHMREFVFNEAMRRHVLGGEWVTAPQPNLVYRQPTRVVQHATGNPAPVGLSQYLTQTTTAGTPLTVEQIERLLEGVIDPLLRRGRGHLRDTRLDRNRENE